MHTQTADKIKVFVDAADFSEKPLKTPFLYPLVGLPDWSKFVEAPMKRGVFDKYYQQGKEYVELAELDNCDYIVFPYNYPPRLTDSYIASRIQVYTEYEQKSGKPVLLFYANDPEVNRLLPEISFKDSVIFANSIFEASRPDYIHSQPAFIKDPLPDYGDKIRIRPKAEKPIIGFCGFASPLGTTWGKDRIREEIRLRLYRFGLSDTFGIDSFHAPRALAIKKLVRSKLIETNFIIRNHSAFHSSKGIFANEEKKYVDNFRKQYFDNIIHSDYIVCARGNGNFSFRLYETLALGRIPVFIDTDAALPFQNQIDWSRYCVWVKERNIARIDELIRNFHNQLTPTQFEQLQQDCRKLWTDFLSPEGFFIKLSSQLKKSSSASYTMQT